MNLSISLHTVRWLTLLLLGVCLYTSASVSYANSPAQAFNQAKNTYRFGDYKKAVQLLRRLLYPKPGRLRSKYLRHEAQKILGISYYYLYGKVGESITQLRSQGRPISNALKQQRARYLQNARFELLNYLSENENARLSSLTYQPDLVSFFNQLRRINKARIARAQKGSARRKQLQTKVIYSQTHTQIYSTPLLLAFLPCGIPQFYSGHVTKGALTMSGCGLALGSYLATYGWLHSLRNERGLFPKENIALAHRVQMAHIVSLATLGAVILYGYIDGFIFFQTKRKSLVPTLPSLSAKQLEQLHAARPHFQVSFRE